MIEDISDVFIEIEKSFNRRFQISNASLNDIMAGVKVGIALKKVLKEYNPDIDWENMTETQMLGAIFKLGTRFQIKDYFLSLRDITNKRIIYCDIRNGKIKFKKLFSENSPKDWNC